MTASREQQRLMKDYYDHTGFGFLRRAEVRADDPEGFVYLWRYNCDWLQNMANDASRIIDKYETRLHPHRVA